MCLYASLKSSLCTVTTQHIGKASSQMTPVLERVSRICKKNLKLLNVYQKKKKEKYIIKVKSMQSSGTEAIRTQLQPPKPKREINNNTNSQNIKRTYGQPNEQLFPKRWTLSNRNRTKFLPINSNALRHRFSFL